MQGSESLINICRPLKREGIEVTLRYHNSHSDFSLPRFLSELSTKNYYQILTSQEKQSFYDYTEIQVVSLPSLTNPKTNNLVTK